MYLSSLGLLFYDKFVATVMISNGLVARMVGSI